MTGKIPCRAAGSGYLYSPESTGAVWLPACIDNPEPNKIAVGKGVKKGVGTGIEKTKDAGQATANGVRNVFTDDDQDSDRDETTAKQSVDPQGRAKSGSVSSDTEANSSVGSVDDQNTDADTTNRELPATAGEQPLLLLLGSLALISAAALKAVRRAPTSR